MLRWPIRIASVVALSVLAYGWGDFATDPAPENAIALGVLSIVLFAALARLYRPGGMAAFEDGSPRRAPGEAAPDAIEMPPPPRRQRPPRERKPKPPKPPKPPRNRASAPVPAPAPAPAGTPPPPPRATPAPTPPRRREGSGSLWSSGRAAAAEPPAPLPRTPAPRTPAPAPEALDLNAATADELAMLPGIGRGAAARVIAHREANGPFRSVAALGEVEGFDAGRVARVAARLRV